ncbi:MAG: N-acetyltransferase [Fimbriimonadaceae bacterium]|nr:N-acetyltransferase [Fimbriimonadaceae bacterium]
MPPHGKATLVLEQPTDHSIRRATVADAAAISALIAPFAARDLMLPRALPALYEGIRDFQVAARGGRLAGCVALHVFDAELGEIKSLAVAATEQGSGLGSQLVRAALQEARALHLTRVFALVLRVGLFERLGFRVVEREQLPQKVWGECIFCPKFHRCDEVAVAVDL